jgi:hypothetical protein
VGVTDVPGRFIPGKDPPLALESEAEWVAHLAGHFGEESNLLPSPGIEGQSVSWIGCSRDWLSYRSSHDISVNFHTVFIYISESFMLF